MTTAVDEERIAIIGMSGRFPGARDIDELWSLLKNGRDARAPLADAELQAAGVPQEALHDPKYVKYCMKIEDPDLFDAEFFGYSPAQAACIDPQQRLFLECAWEALESSGYGRIPEELSGAVFGGTGFNGHLLNLLRGGRGDSTTVFQHVIDAEKDFLATRVAYKLGLTGPGITIQTACSTSLVALHLACRSLLDFECDIALAGGASIKIPQEKGYRHVEGGILSPDFRCRAFDAGGAGTVPGNGVALVVLRRLSDAVASGDQILAVIRSSVVNNDGSHKVGYTAPGLHGQKQLLAAALDLAELTPRDIGMFEAHGTGTPLGDAIELEALNQVYRSSDERRSCALGSIKTNLGHLDAAAGVAGLMKAVLCLKNRFLVPSLNFSTPHALLDTAGCPFYVPTEGRPWERTRGRPRRAAISSFGIGGTNAQVILEEAPEEVRAAEAASEHIFPLSARDPSALRRTADNLAKFLDAHQDVNIADVAHTLQVGRRRFSCRRAVVGTDVTEVTAALLAGAPDGDDCISSERTGRPIIFMFPGQGSQSTGMAAGLYRTDPEFRQDVDLCAERFVALLDADIRQLLCGTPTANAAAGATDPTPVQPAITDPTLVQPAMFVIEYCLARLLKRCGLQPSGVIGHSLGEYAAACVAGVMSVEEATRLVARRAQLTARVPAGSMIVASLAEATARELIDSRLSIAAVNAADQCVISGDTEAVRELAARLQSLGVRHHWLPGNRAFHSPMMIPAAAGLRETASEVMAHAPQIPFVSCVTGTLATQEQLADPDYWCEHMLQPVRFSQGLAELARLRGSIFVEVGPGSTLAGLARRQLGSQGDFSFVACLSATGTTVRADLLRSIGSIWCMGGDIDWQCLHQARRPRRISLPSYPFNKQRFPSPQNSEQIAKPLPTSAGTARLPAERWFYAPSWKRSLPGPSGAFDGTADAWLVFADELGLGSGLIEKLKADGQHAIAVRAGSGYVEARDGSFTINPKAPEQYVHLIETLRARNCAVRLVVHCWGVTTDRSDRPAADMPEALDLGYLSLLFLAQAFIRVEKTFDRPVLAVASESVNVSGHEHVVHAKAALPALCRILGQEFCGARCSVIDLPVPRDGAARARLQEFYVATLLAEATRIGEDPVVAYRGDVRLVQWYEPAPLRLRHDRLRTLRELGFYAITGGLGKIGLALAGRLARELRARLLLITRRPFPERSTWDRLQSEASCSAETLAQIRQIRQMEQSGAEILVACSDLSDPGVLESILADAEKRFGPLHGMFHLAADLKHRSFERRIPDLDPSDLAAQMRPKVRGMQTLATVLRGKSLDFGVAFSSNAAVLGGIGFGVYSAANAVLDSMVCAPDSGQSFPWFGFNWDGWVADGEVAAARSETPGARIDQYALGMSEGLDALWRLLEFSSGAQIVVSALPLEPRLDTWVRRAHPCVPVRAKPEPGDLPARDIGRPASGGRSAGPQTELEHAVAGIWADLLGIEEVGMEANFLDLGGDSLIALRIVARVQDLLGVSIPAGLLIGVRATVAGLVAEIVARMASLYGGAVAEETVAT